MYKTFKVPEYKNSAGKNRKHPFTVREEYRDIKDLYKMYTQVALDYSDNRRCWWIYQHIINHFRHYIKP